MKRILLVVAVLGCEATFHPPIPGLTVAVPIGGPPPTTVATPPEGGGAQPAVAAATPGCNGDSQCMTEEDIVVCPRAKWDCRVGKTMTQPTAESKMQGQFLQVVDGKQLWTDHWYITRALNQGEELHLGQPIVYQQDHVDNRVWLGAGTHDGAIKARWQFGSVTDLSNYARGLVQVEDQVVNATNIRVILNGGTQTPPP